MRSISDHATVWHPALTLAGWGDRVDSVMAEVARVAVGLPRFATFADHPHKS